MRLHLAWSCCAAALLCGCGPKLMPGTADLRVEQLVASGRAQAKDFVPLLAPGAEVRVGDQVASGPAGAALLASVKGEGPTRVIRHHDVSSLVFADGRCLLMMRGDGDRIVKVVDARAPQPGDGGGGWQGIYWDKAWNLDDDESRLALLKAMWADDGRYVDFSNDIVGPEAVSRMIANLRRIAIGTQVVATSGRADIGGGWVMFDWEMRSRLGGRILFQGFDVMHFNGEGKADLDAGFLGVRHGTRSP